MSAKQPRLPTRRTFQTLYKNAAKPDNLKLKSYRNVVPDFLEFIDVADADHTATRMYKQGDGEFAAYYYAWFSAKDRRRVQPGVFSNPVLLHRVSNATMLAGDVIDYGVPVVAFVTDTFSYDFNVIRVQLQTVVPK